MNYQADKQKQQELENATEEASKIMKAFPRGNIGLVADAVKNTMEYKLAKRNFDVSFQALRSFNAVFVKKWRKELAKERAQRCGG